MLTLESILLHLRLRKLLRGWMEFRELSLSYEGRHAPTALAEREFLTLRGELASGLERLRAALPRTVAEAGGRDIDRILAMLKDDSVTTGAHSVKIWDADEFKRVWQEHFINLSRLKGMPLEAAAYPSDPTVAKLPGIILDRRPRGRRFVVLRPLSMGAILLTLWLVFVVARALGVKRSGNGFAMDLPNSLGEAMDNGTALLHSMWAGVSGFLQPVVSNYGPVWTAVMIALLLTAFGYLAIANR